MKQRFPEFGLRHSIESWTIEYSSYDWGLWGISYNRLLCFFKKFTRINKQKSHITFYNKIFNPEKSHNFKDRKTSFKTIHSFSSTDEKFRTGCSSDFKEFKLEEFYRGDTLNNV